MMSRQVRAIHTHNTTQVLIQLNWEKGVTLVTPHPRIQAHRKKAPFLRSPD